MTEDRSTGDRASVNRVVRLKAFGGPANISIETEEVPVPQDDEVLVRVVSAGVNPSDYQIRNGDFEEVVSAADLPSGLGFDLAGRIEAVGPDQKQFAVGDAVFALVGQPSAQADYAVVPAEEVVPAPTSIDLVHAGAVPLAAITAWQGLFDNGGLEAGQSVLVHGGAGGLGHLAVQLAKARGATVYATCSTADLDFVRSLGVERAIDYKSERFEDLVQDLDLVLDLVGGETNARSYAVLREGGTLVSTIQAPDEEAAAKKKVQAPPVFMATPNAGQLREIATLIDAGKVVVNVAESFRLEDVREAQARLERGSVQGKLVLLTGAPSDEDAQR